MLNTELAKNFLCKIDPKNIRRSSPGKPVFIEIDGNPNTGKTTIIETIRYVLQNYGLKVYVLPEFAHYHYEGRETLMYNVRQGINAMENIVENLENKTYDIFLIDRGLFDVYCWVNWRNQYTDEDLSSEIVEVIKKFFICSYFVSYIDIAIFLLCEGKEGIKRDRASKFLNGYDRNKKKKFLSELNISYIQSCNELQKLDNPIVVIDTTYLTLEETEIKVLNLIEMKCLQ